MKIIFTVALLYCSSICNSQTNTELFLFEIKLNDQKYLVENGKNISQNEGYNNQPSFLDNETIMFSSTRNGQTDIAQYHLKYGSKSWLNFSEGSEYSPIKIPNQRMVTAIKLEPDGTQELWKYNLSNGESERFKFDLKIGYQLWYDAKTLITSVLAENGLDLYKTTIESGKNTLLEKQVGRSLHNIPKTNSISFVSKENDIWEIKSVKPKSGESKKISNTLEGSEDFCWLNDNTILMGKGNELFQLDTKKNQGWTLVKRFDSITNITRLAVSPNNRLLAIVAEPTNKSSSLDKDSDSTPPSTVASEKLVQSHIEPYNSKNMKGFLAPFDDDVHVYQFPNRVIYKNKEEMRKGYTNYFNENENLHVTVNNRMSVGSYVIDEEISTVDKSTNRHVTIYNTDGNSIKSMNFISETRSTESPETIVNKQLEGYNSRDIDAFLETYSNDVKLFNYPAESTSQGKSAMRTQYGNMFERITDLNAEIVKRMVIGNKVIDKEKVLVNDQIVYAIAIYEVEDGLISKVTFIQ